MKIITVELTQPIKFSNNSGSEVECNHIELHAPTGKQGATCAAIEGLIKSATLSMAEKLDADTVEDAKEQAAAAKTDDALGEEVKDGIVMLNVMASSGVDMEKVTLYFRELFKQTAWMGGEKLITTPRMDDLAYPDFRKMVGLYAANFILI